MEKLQTLQTIIHSSRASQEKTCVLALHQDDITQWSYADVADRVDRLAHALHRAGVQKGEYVLLLAANSPAWLVACLAVIRTGAAIVPLDTQISTEALQGILPDSGARFMFTTTDYLNRLNSLELDQSPRQILLDVQPDDARGWEYLLGDLHGDLPTVEPDDAAAMFYTSGTTGVPKGVPLTHHNLAYQLQDVMEKQIVSAEDRIMLPLPMYHVYPFTAGTMVPLATGASLILPYSLTGPQIFRALQEGKPTVIVGVPRLLRALFTAIESQFQSRGKLAATAFNGLLNTSIGLRKRFNIRAGKTLLAPVHSRFGKQVRMVTSGGSALDPDLAWKLVGLGWEVAIGYGLSETAPLLTIKMPEALKLGSVGQPLPGVELQIDTAVASPADTAEEAPANNGKRKEGEILARGPNVFAGYHNLPDKTEEVFTTDSEGRRWFRTGDLGWFDDEHYLHISGRASTLIVTESGKNIQPEPIEEVYQNHQFIKEIGILQHTNQLVALIVPEMDEVNRVRNGDVERAMHEAIGAQSKLLPSYQRVADYATTPEPLPKTNLGKLRRHLLVKQYDLAKQGIVETGMVDVGPLPIEDMTEADRVLLEHPAARQVWDWMAERYPDRRLTPDTSPQLDLGIDSLSWLNLTMDISEKTGVELDDEAIKRINTVRDLLQEVSAAAESAEPQNSPVMDPETVLTEEQQQWLRPKGIVLEMLSVLLYTLFRPLMRSLFKVEGRGLENLPTDSNFVLTPNHSSYLDAPAIATLLSYNQMRQTYWAGSVDVMFGSSLMRLVSRLTQTMPVAGEQAGTGRSSLAFASLVLKRKRSLVWFPEGRMSPDAQLLPFRQGIGLVLDHHDTPVIPVFIHGTNDALPPDRMWPRFKQITVTFGKPYRPHDLAQQGEGEKPAVRIVDALHGYVAAMEQPPTPPMVAEEAEQQ